MERTASKTDERKTFKELISEVYHVPFKFTGDLKKVMIELSDNKLTPAEVDRLHAAGGRLVVAPNCDGAVIRRALDLGMRALPGIATATEAFEALRHGATELKLFPASTYGAGHLRALKSVLPKHVKVFAVGGVGSQDIAGWLESGADGFGFGGELFKPAYTLSDIAARAKGMVESLRAASKK